MFSGRINTCRPEQRFSMCCTNISLTLITLHCAIVCENFLSIISLNHPHSYLPGKSPMYVCNYNLGVLLKKKNSYKKVEIDNYDLEECEVVLQYPMHIQSYL